MEIRARKEYGRWFSVEYARFKGFKVEYIGFGMSQHFNLEQSKEIEKYLKKIGYKVMVK